jgi:hypothetical protein
MDGINLRTLYDTGLLFEINRRILHPLGMALAFSWPDDSTDGEPQKVLLLKTDDVEGIIFDSDAFSDGQAKLQSYMGDQGLTKLIERCRKLKFTEQESAFVEDEVQIVASER